MPASSSVSDLPKVVIGLPVHNEAAFLGDALDSLLAQDYPNIEILVSDNGSADGTADIITAYAAQHSHIRAHYFPQNAGATTNFNYVLEQAEGDYFMWAAGHDRWSTNFVSACVHILQDNTAAVLAYSPSSWIDQESRSLDKPVGTYDTRELDVLGRYVTVFWGSMHPVYGLMRMQRLDGMVMSSSVGADLVFLTALAMKGDFCLATGAHWYRRQIRPDEVAYEAKLQRYTSAGYGLAKKKLDRLMPLARLPFLLLRNVVQSTHLSLGVRVMLICLSMFMFPFKYVAGRYLKHQKS